MGVTDSGPIYSERHRTTFLSNFIWYLGVALLVVAIPAAALGSNSWDARVFDGAILLALGAVLAGGHWLWAARRYEIYEGELVVVYGRPRVKVVPYSEVREIVVKMHPLGTEIQLIRVKGGMVRLYPLNPREFHESLEMAWKPHRGVDPTNWG